MAPTGVAEINPKTDKSFWSSDSLFWQTVKSSKLIIIIEIFLNIV
ncbi:hypothetical protein LEP1GSC079_0839 [Leptospira interrogans str. FPW1039]|uniref:Uncharacterized protein n=1 Tax=Leptospira interrogans str. FPW1039 TaxID=1193040 RepID=A0A0F6IKR6_LEPIR|nr:hypothetical protein LEP1GSC079_0839 [Leptospira interrogans str. FPW1039]